MYLCKQVKFIESLFLETVPPPFHPSLGPLNVHPYCVFDRPDPCKTLLMAVSQIRCIGRWCWGVGGFGLVG